MNPSDVADLLRRVVLLEQKVEFLLRHLELTFEAPRTSGVSEEVIALVMQGNKIEAIKQYRRETATDLKEAKDAIDALEQQYLGR